MPLRDHQRIESAELLVGSSPKKTPPDFFATRAAIETNR
jgi:hypothetical protein